ncbi:helix-turn-helix transcriptional regulator [Microbacterium jejuense]|uniref:helix-turn-helix domain-containing protein n=1 Tax=Microbacterium jejuense TaxID=1263637 RepID=UPI0031E5C5CD
MDLVRAISTLRDAAGMTNQELIDRSEMSASYFYGRLRGAAPFDANDIEKLAQALGIHPHEISRVAASIGDAREIEPVVDTDAKELGRRLTAASHAPRLDGSAFDIDGLINELAERGVALDRDEWSSLLAGDPRTPVRVRVLEGVGSYAGVPTAYLLDLDDAAAVEAAEANFEFREALKASGADSVSARAVGEISPAALRAIAQTLRSISAH